tara:strand:+ start:405 stop:632 length:228 start_codon:yes stop_codon:yes gene_type:complete
MDKKNLSRVIEGFRDFAEECGEQTDKINDALSKGDIVDALHHASGYLEAGIQNLSRFWFYTWPLKWGLVAYLILR